MSNEASATSPIDTTEKVTISIPASVLEAIDRNAAADNRSRSNYIVTMMAERMADSATTNTSEG